MEDSYEYWIIGASSNYFSEKIYGDNVGCKARLVVHGNQLEDPVETDSPTVRKLSLRLQFALAAQYGWQVKTADVTAAFLQSDELDRHIYVKPPVEAEDDGYLWLLVKPMYGLDESGRVWYLTIARVLKELGCQSAHNDLAMFFYKVDDKLHGMISLHVDDALYCGSSLFTKNILEPLLARFKFGQFSEGEFKTLGWNIRNEGTDIYVSQKDYIISKLEPIDIKCTGLLTAKLDSEQTTILRKGVGRMRWLADQTRPDVAHTTLELSVSQQEFTHKDVKTMNSLIIHAKATQDFEIKFSKLMGREWFITVFTDASLKSLPGKIKSPMGYIVLMSNGFVPGRRTRCCVLTWRSCTVSRVVTSTSEAETLALSDGLEEAIMIRDQLCVITGVPKDLIKVQGFTDNKDCVEAVRSTKQDPKAKRVAADIAKIKEMIQTREVSTLDWVPSHQQLADALTKRGAARTSIMSTLSEGRFFC